VPPPDAAQAAKEAEEAVQEAIAKLPAEDRAAVTMYFMEELSAAEVARRLRRPERTVRRTIATAREILCIWLEPYWKGVRDGES
jgi:RNA polymerase sigma factor (sigma-70 family)